MCSSVDEWACVVAAILGGSSDSNLSSLCYTPRRSEDARTITPMLTNLRRVCRDTHAAISLVFVQWAAHISDQPCCYITELFGALMMLPRICMGQCIYVMWPRELSCRARGLYRAHVHKMARQSGEKACTGRMSLVHTLAAPAILDLHRDAMSQMTNSIVLTYPSDTLLDCWICGKLTQSYACNDCKRYVPKKKRDYPNHR